MDEILKVTLGIVSGVVLTYVAAILKFRKDLEADFDKDLRVRRLEAYEKLWKILEALARYDLPKPLTITRLNEVTTWLREWYFAKGGLYLSEETRKTYFALKDSIQLALKASDPHADPDVPEDHQKRVLETASLLRASLTKDVRTRRSFPVPDS